VSNEDKSNDSNSITIPIGGSDKGKIYKPGGRDQYIARKCTSLAVSLKEQRRITLLLPSSLALVVESSDHLVLIFGFHFSITACISNHYESVL